MGFLIRHLVNIAVILGSIYVKNKGTTKFSVFSVSTQER